MSFLSVDRLSKSYGEVKALDQFSLDVDRGDIYALVGPDGAGKTTLIRILCNLLDPDSGSVTIDRKHVSNEFDKIKPHLGYMPQQFSLYPDLSVEENLTFYAGIFGITGAAYRQRRERLYQFSNLGPFRKRRALALSGGMKQKLALSCALIHQPQVLILDEPTTGVDPLSRRQFWEILLDLRAQGVTILVSTPYMDEVARADRACFVFGGKHLSEGAPQELADQYKGSIYYFECESTANLIDRLNDIKGLAARRFGAGLHIHVDANSSISHMVSPLSELGIDVDELHPLKPSLEDRFIQLMETTV